MPLVPVDLPPGVWKNGTVYQAKDRWYDSHLMRWVEGKPQPMGPWVPLVSYDTGVSAYQEGPDLTTTGVVRGLFLKTEASPQFRGIYVAGPDGIVSFRTFHNSGVTGDANVDITPASFVTGVEHSTPGAGPKEATTWSFAYFLTDGGTEYLLAVCTSDGRLLENNMDSAQLAAVPGSGSSNKYVFVTPENFVVVVRQNGVVWPSQGDITDWTPGSTDSAGAMTHIFAGDRLLCGAPGRGESLILSEQGLYRMTYVGGDLIYGFEKVGSNCGGVSRHCFGVVDGVAMWMGHGSFYVYDGFVRAIPCEVAEHVFTSLNRYQLAKVWCVVNARYNEITWYYPSDTDNTQAENDASVTYNYKDGVWYTSSVSRTAAIAWTFDPFSMTIARPDLEGALITAEGDTDVYVEDKIIVDGLPEDPTYGGADPYLESGPIEIGHGERVMNIVGIISDETPEGGAELTLKTAFAPGQTETSHGPYDLTLTTGQRQSVRATGRQVRIRYDHVDMGWRPGTIRLDVTPGGFR